MASINLAILIGNLGKDPQLRNTQTGTAVCTFSIATTENWTDQSGQKQSKTEWHNIVVWNKQAENCAKYLRKGRAAYVEGRVQTRSWDDTTGQKRYTTEIIAETVKFLGSGPAVDQERPARPKAEQQSTGTSQFVPPPFQLPPEDSKRGSQYVAGLDDILF
ncbi:MAG TPA: single-stranded DNA-binding protein [Oligoflexus sp.]|uniref:single-stranded DNA-binding protein n=1 Tax=Oligoflexus sp. TaxID=1971216 RepID=UPI002D68CBBE|nr:single-stranded DNA-binding protein [Oligoflexus sp.]HYX39671.1 single-stranded DNA-binding protein [Oligoflexus sp.]